MEMVLWKVEMMFGDEFAFKAVAAMGAATRLHPTEMRRRLHASKLSTIRCITIYIRLPPVCCRCPHLLTLEYTVYFSYVVLEDGWHAVPVDMISAIVAYGRLCSLVVLDTETELAFPYCIYRCRTTHEDIKNTDTHKNKYTDETTLTLNTTYKNNILLTLTQHRHKKPNTRRTLHKRQQQSAPLSPERMAGVGTHGRDDWGDPRENPLASDIVRARFQRAEKSGSDPKGIEPGSRWWEVGATDAASHRPLGTSHRARHTLRCVRRLEREREREREVVVHGLPCGGGRAGASEETIRNGTFQPPQCADMGGAGKSHAMLLKTFALVRRSMCVLDSCTTASPLFQNMLELPSFPQIEELQPNTIFQQSGAPPHRSHNLGTTTPGVHSCSYLRAQLVAYDTGERNHISYNTYSRMKKIALTPFAFVDGNTARLARRSDEALGGRASVARIAPSLLDLGRAAT
ncbi:hypothetical protein PR048_032419 [Dryococelus australis]|uniref:Uncharacterized protein n=1 Tax=Dryococelus australis TaxID=614101 RepID=A0ABQ9G253_9NEOP|nr:hypothetical protein PR048_032419 [Dryococelus australis]